MSKKTILPFGPQHPVLPEPIALRLVLDDEKVIEALPALGYCHRGIEKLAEKKDFIQDVYLIERICGICSFMHSLNYCQGIETIMNVQVPDRAKFLRVIWAELHRIHSHMLYLGLVADSFGFENLFMQVMRAREMVMDVHEKTTGNRVLLSVCSIGGVRRDLSDVQISDIYRFCDALSKEYEHLFTAFIDDETVRRRMVGVGVIDKDKAYQLGAVGPVLRGCGVPMDLRETGYAAYGSLGFKPVTFEGGDCYARTMVRALEVKQCIELIRKAADQMPKGPVSVEVKGNPNGETGARIEQPRGELIFHIKANGTKNLERFKARTPTFANLVPLLQMLPGNQLADVPVIVISIDPCISCTER